MHRADSKASPDYEPRFFVAFPPRARVAADGVKSCYLEDNKPLEGKVPGAGTAAARNLVCISMLLLEPPSSEALVSTEALPLRSRDCQGQGLHGESVVLQTCQWSRVQASNRARPSLSPT